MKLRPIQSAPIFGTILVFAITSATAALAGTPLHSHKTVAETAQPATTRTSDTTARHATGAGEELAVGAAAAAVALMAGGGSSHGQSLDGIVANTGHGTPVKHKQSTTAVPLPSNPVTIISGIGQPLRTRKSIPVAVQSAYVTLQPPALVVTAPLHRRVTTTSVVIPTPTAGTTALLQVHRVDRFINQAPVDIVQTILPAHAVDRTINFGDGNKGPGSTPEPAPGLILLSGVLGVGALVFFRKRRVAAA